jgi:uncharacterized protein
MSVFHRIITMPRPLVVLLVFTVAGCVSAPPPLSREFEVHNVLGSVPGAQPPTGPACWKILAIDGGGVRGIIPAILLDEIQSRLDQPIHKYFDVISGTSTGSLLALGLTRPDPSEPDCPLYSTRELAAFYDNEVISIFPPGLAGLDDVRHLLRRKYDHDRIEQVFDRLWGDAILRDALAPLRIPAYEIETRRHFFFDSHGSTANFLMRDAARASTAAPTYFPPHRIAVADGPEGRGYRVLIDGGVFANNPTPFALDALPSWARQEKALVVSLGTGNSQTPIKFEEAWRWGTLGWARPLLDIVFSDPGADRELEVLMKRQGHDFFRLQPRLSPEVGALDDSDPKNIALLRKIARDFAKDNAPLLNQIARELSRDKVCPTEPGPAGIRLRRATHDIDSVTEQRRRSAVCRR